MWCIDKLLLRQVVSSTCVHLGVAKKRFDENSAAAASEIGLFFKRTKYGLDAAAASVDQVFVQLNYILMHLL